MRQKIVFRFVAFFYLLLFSLLAGCVSLRDTPAPRFYSLQAVGLQEALKKFDTKDRMIVGINIVRLPQYLARPQIVTAGADGTFKFSQFDRWVEPFDFELTRAIREDLSAMLPDASFAVYPWTTATPVKYQLSVEIIKLICDLDRDLYLKAQWSIFKPQTSELLVMKVSEWRQPVATRDYSGLAKSISQACASLSEEIAQALASL